MLPVVLGVLGLVLYLLVYQYDRVILEQDLGMLSVRVSSYTLPGDLVEQEFTRLQHGLVREKYILGIWQQPKVEKGLGKVLVRGKLQLPVWIPVLKVGEQEHDISAGYTNIRLSPLFVIRSCEKVKKY